MLQACLNGNRDRQFHPGVPYAAKELALDTEAAVGAGADELHVHPREAAGRESLDPDDTAEAIRAIRACIPGIPLGLSTGWWIAPVARKRQEQIRAWHLVPDYVSVNLVEEDAPEVMALVLEKGIGVEAGLWSRKDAERFVALPDATRCVRVLIEINQQDPSAGRQVAQDIIGVLDHANIGLPRLLHGCDRTKWAMFQEALRLKLDTRIGLEDSKLLPSGREAKSNADLIRGARALMR